MNATLGAGMDKDCSGFLDNQTIVDSVTHHGVSEDVVDDALRHSIAVTFRLGVADPLELNPFNSWTNITEVNSPAHQALAKDAAIQSLVLLKNVGNSLPWTSKQQVKENARATARPRAAGTPLPTASTTMKNAIAKVAVIGRMASATDVMLGNYRGAPKQFTTVCQGIAAHVTVTACINGSMPYRRANGKPPGKVTYSYIYNVSAQVDVGEAVAAVDHADAVVLVSGKVYLGPILNVL